MTGRPQEGVPTRTRAAVTSENPPGLLRIDRSTPRTSPFLCPCVRPGFGRDNHAEALRAAPGASNQIVNQKKKALDTLKINDKQ